MFSFTILVSSEILSFFAFLFLISLICLIYFVLTSSHFFTIEFSILLVISTARILSLVFSSYQ